MRDAADAEVDRRGLLWPQSQEAVGNWQRRHRRKTEVYRVEDTPSRKTGSSGADSSARPAADHLAVVLALGCGRGQRLLGISAMVVERSSTAVPFPL